MDVEKIDLGSLDIAEDKREGLLRLFPEARTEGGQVDFDRLRAALGDIVDAGKERYGLNWPGKRDCFRAIQTPSQGTLRPCKDDSVDWDSTGNLIIEGDNLEVLKLLQKSYLGRIKMIYIDPPYNTGNDFIYPDNYSESLQTYLQYTGQVDSAGRKFSSNTDTDGRFHSRWLNMMYPRLYLARNLLREDGVIFISIDENESSNLEKVCSEIFGEENYVGRIAVQLNPRGRHLDKYLAKTHEYLAVFVKDGDEDSIYAAIKDERMAAEYRKSDGERQYRELELRNRNPAFNRQTRPNLYYPIYADPDTAEVSLRRDSKFSVEIYPANSKGEASCWTWGKDKLEKDKSLVGARRVRDGSWRVFRRDYLIGEDGESAKTLAKSLWMDKEINNDVGKKAVQELFGENVFDFPKSPALIRKMLEIGAQDGDLVLDFFAGSGVTADAVLHANAADQGTRKFVLVQLPEPIEHSDYATIADITKERVRRVINKLNADDNAAGQDRGFRVYQLAESNFTAWASEITQGDTQALKQQLALHIEHIRADRSVDDLLFEILLKSGYPLTVPVETLQLADKTVYAVAGGELLVCLDAQLTLDLIRAIADRHPERVVCLDRGFAGQDGDALKTNAVKIFESKHVKKFQTV